MENLKGRSIKSYAISELIDIGGFGAVYRAMQDGVLREVAIKVINPIFANRPAFIQRFESEAQVIASLEHPHIVPLYDYWRDPQGAYIVMRWLRGGHLRSAMDKHQEGWDVSEVFQLLVQISSALAFAHRYGVIHRDLKPENILLDEEGNVYLADFGIAQIVNSGADDDEFGAMGSPAYAAPEQIANTTTNERTDIYSLGIILFELLAGQHPFPDLAENTVTTLTNKRLSERLPSLRSLRPDLPESLDAVIQRATALNSDERYADVISLVNAFRGAAFTPDQRITSTLIPPSVILAQQAIPNPYKGLRAFQEADASNFFGRTRLIQTLISRLTEDSKYNRFLAVVGPSGSGKSSVVKAGLIPALRRGDLPGSERWYYIDMVPGLEPYRELESALNSIAISPPENLAVQLHSHKTGLTEVVQDILPEDERVELVLVIDQFEEVFTLVENEQITFNFLETLQSAVTAPNSRIRIIITLRADFYDRPLLRPALSEIISQRTEVVIPLNQQELELAILEPARRAGVTLEAGLVPAIINEVNQQIGALPLLQYLMSELFELRTETQITIDSYRRLGGVRGALAKRAEDFFQELSEPQQEIARQIFLRLITLGEGTEDTRRRALVGELTSISKMRSTVQDLIELLGKSRLLTFDRDPETRSPTLEVTHEALIREWQRLRQWLDASRTDVRMQRNLALAAEDWHKAQYDNSFLLRGIRLEQYEVWAGETNIALATDEQNFLGASIAMRQQEAAQEQARQAREADLERRARNRLRILVAVLAIATTIAFILTGFALNESRRAQQESELTRSLAQEASARRALADADTDLAIVLALEANRIPSPAPQAWRTLAEVALAPGTRRVFVGHTASVLSADISADGTIVVSASQDATVRLWDASTGNQIGSRMTAHQADVQAVRLSPDGQWIASSASDSQVIITSVATQAPIYVMKGHTVPAIRALAFSPDSRLLYSGDDKGEIIVWDVQTGVEVQRIYDPVNGHTVSIRALDVSPDGNLLLTGALNGLVVLWDARSGQLVQRLEGHTSAVRSVDFNTTGNVVLSASSVSPETDSQTALFIWDMSDFTPTLPINRFEAPITSAAFIPGTDEILVGLEKGDLQIWNFLTGTLLVVLNAHEEEITQVAVTPDGQFAVSSAKDTRNPGSKPNILRVWQLRNPAMITAFTAHDFRITGAAFSPDGRTYFTEGVDGSVRQWDASTHTLLSGVEAVEGRRGTAISIHPSGAPVLIGFSNGETTLWTPQSGETRPAFPQQSSAIQTLSFSPDGTRVMLNTRDEGVALWDFVAQSPPVLLRSASGSATTSSIIADAVFSPDGQFIFSGSRTENQISPTLHWWDANTGEQLSSFAGYSQSIRSVDISRDGQVAASGAQDGTIVVWDVATQAERARLQGHTEAIWSVRFSHDGHWLVSSAEDGYVILWDIASASEIQRFTTQKPPAYEVSFSPDDQLILIGEQGGRIEIWRTFTLADLMVWAEINRYIRPLNCIEAALYRVQSTC